MRVEIHTAGLRRTKWHECALRFILGGAITVIAGLITRKFGPAMGGLFLAFPAIFPASATLVEKHEREKKEEKGRKGIERGKQTAAQDAMGAAMGSLGLLVFAVLVWLLLPTHKALWVLIGAGIAWLLASCAIWALRQSRRRIKNIFTTEARRSRRNREVEHDPS
jgi:4-hydroxybenzoate polyprenyltransferase